jgi:hypothetical protein
MQGAQRCAKSAATTGMRNGRKLNLLGGLFTDWLFEVTAELEAHRGEELILVVRFAARKKPLVEGRAQHGNRHPLVNRSLDCPPAFSGIGDASGKLRQR